MKKVIALIYCFLVIFILTSCASKNNKEIICEDLILAYETAGYSVYHDENPFEEKCNCTVIATDTETQEYIIFNFFNSDDDAKEYKKGRKYNIIIYFFAVIFGETRWMKVDTYKNIEFEYLDKSLYQPFKNLL